MEVTNNLENNQPGNNSKSLKKKVIKMTVWFGGIIFVILTILYIIGSYADEINGYLYEKQMELTLAPVRAEYQRIEDLQKNDTYGGKTPEETLDLYIQALKAGDIELASKYVEISTNEPDLQKKEIESLKQTLYRDGNFDLIIDNTLNSISFGKKREYLDTLSKLPEVVFSHYFITEKEFIATSTISGGEVIDVTPIGTRINFGIVLRQNPYTKVWKIIQ